MITCSEPVQTTEYGWHICEVRAVGTCRPPEVQNP